MCCRAMFGERANHDSTIRLSESVNRRKTGYWLTFAYAYDPLGRIQYLTLPDSTIISYAYDGRICIPFLDQIISIPMQS